MVVSERAQIAVVTLFFPAWFAAFCCFCVRAYNGNPGAQRERGADQP